jgi:hypothetical protein
MEKMTDACEILDVKPGWKRPFGRPKRRWENITVMDVMETVCESVDWTVSD